MCECMEYSDGFRLLCPVCKDIADYNDKEAALNIKEIERLKTLLYVIRKRCYKYTALDDPTPYASGAKTLANRILRIIKEGEMPDEEWDSASSVTMSTTIVPCAECGFPAENVHYPWCNVLKPSIEELAPPPDYTEVLDKISRNLERIERQLVKMTGKIELP